MVWFLVICILFEERLQGKWKPFPRKASRITAPPPPFKFDIRTLHVPCQTLRQLKSQEGAVFVFNSSLCFCFACRDSKGHLSVCYRPCLFEAPAILSEKAFLSLPSQSPSSHFRVGPLMAQVTGIPGAS